MPSCQFDRHLSSRSSHAQYGAALGAHRRHQLSPGRSPRPGWFLVLARVGRNPAAPPTQPSRKAALSPHYRQANLGGRPLWTRSMDGAYTSKPQPWWQPEVTTDLTEPVLVVKVTLVEHCHACQCAAHPSAPVPDTLQPATSVAKPATTSSSAGADTHIDNLDRDCVDSRHLWPIIFD